MRTVEIVGFNRHNLGKAETKRLRREAQVPCVLYGSDREPLHFYTPAILFRDLIYTPEAAFVALNVEGMEVRAMLKDAQFHPVSEMILHADFMAIEGDSPVVMEIPVRTEGTSPGVVKGGSVFIKQRRLKVKATPSKMPQYVAVSVAGLDLGKSLRVRSIATDGFEILNQPAEAVVTVTIPRALRSRTSAAEAEVEEGEAEEAATEAAE